MDLIMLPLFFFFFIISSNSSSSYSHRSELMYNRCLSYCNYQMLYKGQNPTYNWQTQLTSLIFKIDHRVRFGDSILLVELVVIFHPPPCIRATLNTSDIFALLGPHCLDSQDFQHAAVGLTAFTQPIGRDPPFFRGLFIQTVRSTPRFNFLSQQFV